MVWKEVKPRFIIKNKLYPTKETRWLDRDTGLRKNFDGTLEKPTFLKKPKGVTGPMTKKQKQVACKAMYDAGWGSKQLSQWFKINPATVQNWKKIPTPDSLKEFEHAFKSAMMDYDMEATVKIKNRIMDVVPNETDLNKLVKAGEFFQGMSDKRKSQNNTQVNIYADMLKKYGSTTVIDGEESK